MDIISKTDFSDEVAQALSAGRAVLALESTVISHGLPYPQNRATALAMEAEARRLGVTPATIAVLDGRVKIGISPDQLERLALAAQPGGEMMYKISRRDFAPALALGRSGGTTVAGTMVAAQAAGMRVFATGGIGGVHHSPTYDISADLPELARTPLVVVCAGAKAILNLDATLEYLETAGVPVVGYCTDEFPAFYSRESGLRASTRADSAAEIAAMARAHWAIAGSGALLVGNPPPEASALPRREVETVVQQALAEAAAAGVRGQAVTPFLLARVNALTEGASMQANLALLRNNARLGAEIALELAKEVK
jgi:pseudouridine-5'-phosphate glycosidase